MKTVEENLEQISIGLYRNYNISEWREKCLILSKEEQTNILNDLKSQSTSPLIEMVKLPFPKFVELYYSQYPGAEEYLKDASFPYKLYLMPEAAIIYLNAKIKFPKTKIMDLNLPIYTKKLDDLKARIREILYNPLENVLKLKSVSDKSRELPKKFIYISQYIDSSEAERLQLTGFTFRTPGGVYRGFDLEGKLALFNHFTKLLLVKYLGLYGHFRTSAITIAHDIHVEHDKIDQFLNMIFDSLLHTTGMLKNKIG